MSTPIIPDPIQAGIARGWKIVDAAALTQDRSLEADVVVGSGGGVTAEILARSGASGVQPADEMARRHASWPEAKAAIAALPQGLQLTRVASAHVMGGCAMSGDERLGVTTPEGRYRGLSSLSVHDGSLFPTSLGTNPQLTIYGLTAKLASSLATALTGRPAARLDSSRQAA